MFTARIMIILAPPVTAQAAAETIARAVANASRPSGLAFALPHTMEGFVPDLPEGAEPLYYDAVQGLSGAVACLTSETHFLFLTGPHAFRPRWDALLYGLWHRFDKYTLLTASLTPAPAADNAASPDGKRRVSIANSDPQAIRNAAKNDPAVGKLAELFDGEVIDIHRPVEQ